MNDKIIGFTICQKRINHKDIDVFKVGLKLRVIKNGKNYVYIWGIGNLDNCYLSDDCFSLSFPLKSTLLDRNVNVQLLENKVVIENDWLGSIPIFYNVRSGVISTLINKVIDSDDVSIDPDGFNNYLDFGFSVFEQTPIKNVRFMRYYSKMIITDVGFKLINKDDLEFMKNKIDSNTVISKMKQYINSTEKKITGRVIIPTSGGYDSRLLNYLISDKSRIESYTYGVSKNQKNSDEVIKAKKLTDLLEVNWHSIELKDFNKFYKEWFFLYGPAVHLHGMYHIEFYKKILKQLKGQKGSVLSGFFGDVWSGNVVVPEIKSAEDLTKLGYTHDLRLDPNNSLLKSNKKIRDLFWREHRKKTQKS